MPASHLKLSELNAAIKQTLNEQFRESIWVVAEIARINANYSGHTYIDLVEKRGSETLAQAKATIWRTNNRILEDYASAAGQPLSAGVAVLLLARLDYHPVYGLSLNVVEIDPSFTIGEMARRRQEVIDRLLKEGLYDRNRSVPISPVPQRIAVISSATAAGWEDFRARLATNPYGFAFNLQLFAAIMQGDGSEASIITALKFIQASSEDFDAVVIIRGGGGVVDLSCFDSYVLASAIAGFPLPVITGIGHERDTSVADLVAYHRADTPTASAEYLISLVGAFDVELSEFAERIAELAMATVNTRKLELADAAGRIYASGRSAIGGAILNFDTLARRCSSGVRNHVEKRSREATAFSTTLLLRSHDYMARRLAQISEQSSRLVTGTKTLADRSETRLNTLASAVRLRSPEEAQRLGFSITRVNGRAIRSIQQAPPGAVLETTLADGKIVSTTSATE